jgi:hypothetical protein
LRRFQFRRDAGAALEADHLGRLVLGQRDAAGHQLGRDIMLAGISCQHRRQPARMLRRLCAESSDAPPSATIAN